MSREVCWRHPRPPGRAKPRGASVVEQGPHDGADVPAGGRFDRAELVDESPSADRAHQLALDVAGVVETGDPAWLDLHVEVKSSTRRREWTDDDEREVGTERVGRPEDEGRTVVRRLGRERFTEVDEPEFVT